MQSEEAFLLSRGVRILHYDVVTSTNELGMQAIENGEKEDLLIVADEQTKGKGRRGRSFYSKGTNNIYMSLVLRPQFSVKDSLLITVAACVAICNAIEKNTGKQLGIKWVNDIFLNGKKICGILAEGKISEKFPEMFKGVVVGVGVNLFPFDEKLPDEIADIAGTVYEQNECSLYSVAEREDISKKIIYSFLTEFYDYYDALTERKYMDKYRERSILIGKNVIYLCGDSKKNIHVIDIDNDGYLVVLEDGERKVYDSGEISIGSKLFRLHNGLENA